MTTAPAFPSPRIKLIPSGTEELIETFVSLARAATSIKIATAYISPFATEQVLSQIADVVRPDVIVGASRPETKQLDGIRLLSKIADVWLYVGAKVFHPKVYLFKDKESSHAILGSSNLTQGGFAGNVEANLLLETSSSDPLWLGLLAEFEAWRREAAPVSSRLLQALQREADIRAAATELVEGDPAIAEARSEIKRILAEEAERLHSKPLPETAASPPIASPTGAAPKESGHRPFFRMEHRSAFAPEKHTSGDGSVNEERRRVSMRFAELHDSLLHEIKNRKWDLHPHPKKDNLTSSWNLNYVAEIDGMWLAYGRSADRFRDIPDDRPFNHVKLQLLLQHDVLLIGLMLAQKGSDWDREFIHKKAGLSASAHKDVAPNPDRFCSLLNEALVLEPAARLERWFYDSASSSWGTASPETRNLTVEDLQTFVSNDRPGDFLGLWVRFDPDDASVSEELILDSTLRVFQHFYRTYDFCAWDPRR